MKFLRKFLGIGEFNPNSAKRPPIPEGMREADKKELLAAIPEIHPAVERVINKRYGSLLQWDITVDTDEKRNGLPKFFFRNQKRKHKVVLDPMGKKTIDLIDGKRTLSEISDALASETGHNKSEMQNAVLTFIGQLARRNAVILRK